MVRVTIVDVPNTGEFFRTFQNSNSYDTIVGAKCKRDLVSQKQQVLRVFSFRDDLIKIKTPKVGIIFSISVGYATLHRVPRYAKIIKYSRNVNITKQNYLVRAD